MEGITTITIAKNCHLKQLEKIYLAFGTFTGFALWFVCVFFSLSIQHANPTFKNIVELHYQYPIHFIIDFFPIVFAFIFLLIGIKRRRYNSSKARLKKLLVQQDQAIRETNKKLSAFFNSSSDINILLNLDNTIIAYNKAASAFMKRIESEQPLYEGNDIR